MDREHLASKEIWDAFQRAGISTELAASTIAILDRYLRALFQRMLRNFDDADLYDCAADTKLHVIEKMHEYDPSKEMLRWINGIARNVAREKIHKADVEQRHRRKYYFSRPDHWSNEEILEAGDKSDTKLRSIRKAYDQLCAESNPAQQQMLAAGWALLNGASREAVMQQFGIAKEDTYRVKNFVKYKIRKIIENGTT